MNNSEVFEQVFERFQLYNIIGCWVNDDGKYCVVTQSNLYIRLFILFEFRLDENNVRSHQTNFIQRLALVDIV